MIMWITHLHTLTPLHPHPTRPGLRVSPRDDIWHLAGDFIVDWNYEKSGKVGGDGVPYPAVWMADGTIGEAASHNDPKVGWLPGWDSHMPLFMAFEDPAACNLVLPDEVIPIGESNIILHNLT